MTGPRKYFTTCTGALLVSVTSSVQWLLGARLLIPHGSATGLFELLTLGAFAQESSG